MKGQLPKAYLRIDPNLDQHPDALGMLKLICAANRQHPRGYFQRVIAQGILGRKRLVEFTTPRPGKARPDLVELDDGRLYLEGWEHWQEGDWTVGERVARLRAKRDGTVTGPLPDTVSKPLPPSEALGVKALGTENGNGAVSTSTSTDLFVNGKQGDYCRVIWEEHCRRRGSDLPLVSSAEYDLMASWYEAGIPARVVLRGMEDTKAKAPRLTYYGPSVAEAAAYWRRATA